MPFVESNNYDGNIVLSWSSQYFDTSIMLKYTTDIIRFDYLQLKLSSDEKLRALPEEVTVNLYRVIQEALTNVSRHAQAHQVALSLEWENAHLQLVIQDDGSGFVPPFAPDELTSQGHFGLAGMQERVDLIGGKLVIKSASGEGTEILTLNMLPLFLGE